MPIATRGLVASATMLLVLAIGSTAGAAEPPRGLDIYVLDAQGGAATLVITPEGESVLIDSGWPGQEDRDPKRIVHALKEVAGLDHLDHLVTTHWHTDHYGGVAGLAKLIRIDHFWDRGLPEDRIDGQDFPDGPKADEPLGVAYRAASVGRRKALLAGDTLPLKGDVKVDVLASGGKVGPAPRMAPNPLCEAAPADRPDDPSDNARSLVLRFHLGAFTFLDCGDLTWNVEKALVCPVDRIGPVDVYQVTHHGMDISNHPTLVQTIAPTVAIINNGPRKGGSPGVVALLQSLPKPPVLYQLHKNAATSADENTEPGLIANSDPAGGQYVRVNVNPDGSRYVVRIGEDGPARDFESRGR